MGVGLSSVAVNAAWAESLDYEYEVWSDLDGVLVAHYDAWSEFDDAPLRHAYILDDQGVALVKHEGAVSVGADPASVLEDCARLFGGD